MGSSRQLAAILFADIVGYTGLMQEDESNALELLQKLRNKLEEVVGLHQGRILEFRGDGALCRFSSTLESVRAAIALQLDMQTEPMVPLRIGLHTGDIIISGDSIYGDGVNVASRMESFSIAGSIFISGRVYEDIKNQKEIRTLWLGMYSLKNVKEDIQLYAIANPGLIVPTETNLKGKGDGMRYKCILVLPFVNLSQDVEKEYFSDGLTEELISNLSRLQHVRVISRTTSMKYKGTNLDLKAIGRETGATYVMEGSVRQSGNHLRITAQLVDAIQDIHLWSDSYSGLMDNIFDIQEKVASKIVEALRIQLTDDEKDSLLKRFTDNTEAYQLYLQGRYFWNKRNEEGLQKAVQHFEYSIEKDPNYALAWSGLADTYNMLGEFTSLSRRELYPNAKAAVEKALLLDNQLAEAHISLACLRMINEWDWAGAYSEFKIGLGLNPYYATGHHWYAEWLQYMGRLEEAIREIAIAVDLDPISQAIAKDQGMIYYYGRQYDLAIEKAQISKALDPDFHQVHRLLSLCYQGKGLFEKAIAEHHLWSKRIRNEVKSNVALAQIYAAAGRKKETLDLITSMSTGLILTGNDFRGMALVYASLGDADTAFKWMEKSIAKHEESLVSMGVDPKFDPIREDPRFKVILAKLGLPT
jgi:TolB-like protein/class 3 adenylate cyclase/lipoprotein NlpI